MGIWKRVTEKTRQAIGLKADSVDWRPTSNARNLAMIEEARRFSKQLKILHRELRELESRFSEHMTVLKGVLASPLPRVYEMSDKGPVPLEREAVTVGAGVNGEVFPAAVTELKSRLQNEVLYPLDQWQAAYRMIKARNAKAEELRLELDAKRRDAAAMAVNLHKIKTKAAGAEGAGAGAGAGGEAAAGPTGGNNPNANKVEDAEFRLQKQEDKVTRLAQRFRDIEEEVYTALLTLINDTKVLKQYAAVALTVFKRSFGQAHTAFGAADALPLPVSSGAAGLCTPSPAKMPSPVTGADGGYDRNPSLPASHSAYPKVPPVSSPAPTTPDPTKAPPPPAGSPPELQPQLPAPPPPPAWYNEAKQQARPMQYDSDDDN